MLFEILQILFVYSVVILFFVFIISFFLFMVAVLNGRTKQFLQNYTKSLLNLPKTTIKFFIDLGEFLWAMMAFILAMGFVFLVSWFGIFVIKWMWVNS